MTAKSPEIYSRLKKVDLLLIMALLITIVSVGVARLGTPYVCIGDGMTQQNYNRDERGIPFVFLERSVQVTGCGPSRPDGSLLDTETLRVIWLNLTLDVLAWTLVLGASAYAFPRVWRKL